MRVKICGITNLEDALASINFGADALGFVFYEPSPRYITPKNAKEIIEKLPPFVECVGLFVNKDADFINSVCKESKISLAQIIDDSGNLDFEKIEVKSIKVIRASSKEDISNLDKDKYYLVDAFVEGFGGAGKRVALEWFDNADCSKIIIAGGLTDSNLRELDGYNFYGVDVSSGVEAKKGKKDIDKLKQFLKVANEIK